MKTLILFLIVGNLLQDGHTKMQIVCSLICSWSRNKCFWYCRTFDYSRRSADEGTGSFTVLLPCKFEAWDLNGNGGISFDEFEFTGRISNIDNDKTGKDLFQRLDQNGDGELSKNELDAGNLERENC